jgi:hypothetical protein
MSVLEALARADVVPGPPLAEVVRRVRARLAWGSTVVAIAGRESDDLLDALATLKQAGFAVSLVLVQGPAASALARRRAALLGMPLRQIWQASDLEQWA